MKEAWACKICFDEVMTPPIYQCSDGHTFCAICKDNLLLMNKPRCGQCRADLLTSSIRCLYAEQDMRKNNLFVECNDCKEAIPFDNFLEHKPQCKPKIFSCDRCKKTGLTIAEYIHCMENHRQQPNAVYDGQSTCLEPLVVHCDRFGIRHAGRLERFDLMFLNDWSMAIKSTSYIGLNSGCDTAAALTAWKSSNAAIHGYAGPDGKTFTFDLQAAEHPETNPSVQYGIKNGFMVLLNDTRLHAGQRYPPVLLRFFLYRKNHMNSLALTVKIIGSNSEIRRLKLIDDLCLCIKLGSEYRGRCATEMVDKVRISGENLFKPEVVYSLHGYTNYPPDELGLDQSSSDRVEEYMEVIFTTQKFNDVHLTSPS